MLIGLLFALQINGFKLFAQILTPLRSVSTLLINCNGGNAFLLTDTVALVTGGISVPYYCKSPGVWVVYTSGGGGTPGGTTNQIQYNNAGSFGGFTLNGDCTVVVSTGVVTCTKSNGSAFGSAAFTSSSAYLLIGGGTLTGKLNTLASSSSNAGLNIALGSALTSLINGDVWTTSTNSFHEINGNSLQDTYTLTKGTASLNTNLIASGACDSVVSVTATGVASTDTILASFNGDLTGVTGYIPSTSGMLVIFVYLTSGDINFKVCNNTLSSITLGAITLNWRVVR